MASAWTGFKRAASPFARTQARYLFITLTWIPVVVFIKDHVAELLWVDGRSMSPYFNERHNETKCQDTCLNWKFYAQENLQRGMIVNFRNPMKPERGTIKRIVGLPGDIVHTRPPFPQPYIRVPPNHIWVEGDAGGTATLDSNTYGPISIRLVQGRITHIVWPLRKVGRVRWWEHFDRLAEFKK